MVNADKWDWESREKRRPEEILGGPGTRKKGPHGRRIPPFLRDSRPGGGRRDSLAQRGRSYRLCLAG